MLKVKGKRSMENSNSASLVKDNESANVDNVLTILSSDCHVDDE